MPANILWQELRREPLRDKAVSYTHLDVYKRQAQWVTAHVGSDWITDLSKISGLKIYAEDKKAQQEFMNIKYQNKVRLANYILEHNGVEVDPRSIFDVQVKRLHEYKRQLLNILHIMYLYNGLKENPDKEFYPRTFIFGAKAAAGYRNAKPVSYTHLDVYKRQAFISGMEMSCIRSSAARQAVRHPEVSMVKEESPSKSPAQRGSF